VNMQLTRYDTARKVNPLKFSTTQKSWNLSQITEAYAKDGYEDYAEVREFHMDTGIPLGLCFSMFYGEVASSNNAKKHIRSGGYRVKDRKHPYKVARIALSANSYCDFALKTNFIIALSKCITVAAFDEKRIVRNFEKHGALLAPCRSADEYIVLLEKIYNYAAKGERLYLVVEVDKAMRQRKVGK